MRRIWIIIVVFPVLGFSFQKEKLSFGELLSKVKENPSNTFYLSCLAEYHEKQEKWDEAIKLYKKCLVIEPENSFHYIGLAKAWDKNGRPDLGLCVMSNAVLYFEKNEAVYSEYASLQYDMGDFKTALSAYEKALSLADKKEQAFIMSGIAKTFRELKEYEKSKVYFQKALQIKTDCWTFYEYGKLFFETREFEQSIWAFNKAKALSYNLQKEAEALVERKLAGSYYAYGIKLKDSGKKEEARIILSKIVENKNLQDKLVLEKAEFWLKRL